jgi:hypothetical protein
MAEFAGVSGITQTHDVTTSTRTVAAKDIPILIY